MTDIQPDNATPDEGTVSMDAAPFSVGTALREARVHLGLSVDEVSHHVKFAPRQIEALEADDFEHLPETAFLRGFVRSYARLLQLDSTPLLAALPHAPEQLISQEDKAQAEVPYPNIYTERKQNIIWLAAALAVAVALGLTAWLLGDGQKEQTSSKVAVSTSQNATVETLVQPEIVPVSAIPETTTVSSVSDTQPVTEIPGSQKLVTGRAVAEINKTAEVKNTPQVVVPPAQTATLPVASPAVKPATATNLPGQVAIHMTFDGDSWVEITESNGKYLLSQINRAGSELTVNGTPPVSLVIGNSKSVHLYFKGQAIDLAQHTKVAVARLTLE